jgi:hypothetical protein
MNAEFQLAAWAALRVGHTWASGVPETRGGDEVAAAAETA